MGLLKAAASAVSTVLADQWKEYFYCESLSEDVLVAKGVKNTSSRSTNRGSDNIITKGSAIAVNEGQAMMIVEQGAIVEFSAEPGVFTFDSSTEPTIFEGGLGKGIKDSWQVFKKRFTYGGDTAKDQRIYYFNIKEIIGNKYGTASAVPFRVVDRNIGLDMDVSVKCFGEYSYKITDPILFYKNVSGNVAGTYTRDKLDSQLKSEFLGALQPAFAKIGEQGIRYSALPGHTTELADSMNEVLSAKWSSLRGISVVSVGVNSVKADEEDEKIIKDLQKTAVFRDPTMGAAYSIASRGDAMKTAAGNAAGAMVGFAGMNMVNGFAGADASQLYAMGQQQQAAAAAAAPAAPAAETWTCACGAVNTGKFCTECGEKKPEPKKGWTCPSCGAVNTGKFCQECGAKKPADAPLYKCDKCGWEPEDPAHPPKFCPQCGDKFDENDIQ